MKYVMIQRIDSLGDCIGSYIEEIEKIPTAISGEMDCGLENNEFLVLSSVEMDEEEFKNLPEFMGY